MKMIMNRSLGLLFWICLSAALTAQDGLNSKTYLDKILEKRTFTPAEIATLNKDGIASIDVRDLAIFLNGQPISATFGAEETLAFQSAGSVTLPILFSKPVTGTIKLDLGGSAAEGSTKDFTILYHNAGQKSFSVTNATSLQITIQFPQWRGMGGEKIVRLTIGRDPTVLPANGSIPTHLLRVRQFEAGEFVGVMSFPAGAGLPTTSVRVGLRSNGTGICSFQQSGGLLGTEFSFNWGAGERGFPNFSSPVALTIPGDSIGRSNAPADALRASLVIQTKAAPYGAELDAYLDGFPADDQPALYDAVFTFHNLIKAGDRFPPGSNPYSVVHQGRLTLQPVRYPAAP